MLFYIKNRPYAYKVKDTYYCDIPPFLAIRYVETIQLLYRKNIKNGDKQDILAFLFKAVLYQKYALRL